MDSDEATAGWRNTLLEAIADRNYAEKTMRRRNCTDRMWNCMWMARRKCDEIAAIAIQGCGGMASPW